MSTFINPPIVTTTVTNSTRNLDKSYSMIENLILDDDESTNDMSYKSTDIQRISRHLSESGTGPVKQNYEDLVSCSVCMDQFDAGNNLKLPKILPCQHTYCVECINNCKEVSNEPGNFECPQCKFKIEKLTDASELPTSRMVLTLLEKDSLNYQGYAACPSCRQIRNLEVCFECNLPLCVQCIGKHFELWKNDIHSNCIACEESLENYKSRIDAINPFITKNFETVQSIKNEIDDAFNLLFQRLNTEKETLIRTVNEIKDENSKYIQFKKEIVAMIASFKVFRESNENYEKKLMPSRMKKIQANFEQIPKIQNDYSAISSIPFRVLEKFDKKPIPEKDFIFSGPLIISDLILDKSQPNLLIKSHAPTVQTIQTQKVTLPKLESVHSIASVARIAPTAPPSINKSELTLHNSASFSSLNQDLKSIHELDDTVSLKNSSDLSDWTATSNIKPQSEATISNTPNLMTSFGNILFCMDNASNLSIYERAFSMELKLKNSNKLSVPNVKSIAANENYFAVAYSGTLKKDQMKGVWKNASPNGVMLFLRQQFVVLSIHDRIMELKNNESFKQPSGLALTDKYLFVCDKELRSVFKFDLKSFSLVQRIPFKDTDPYSVSVAKDTFIVTDTKSNMYMFDLESCAQLKSTSLKLIDQINSCFSTVSNNDGLLFVKNSENQLCLLDSDLEQRSFFNQIQAKILSISFINQPGQMLIIGCVNSSQQNKLYSYVI